MAVETAPDTVVSVALDLRAERRHQTRRAEADRHRGVAAAAIERHDAEHRRVAGVADAIGRAMAELAGEPPGRRRTGARAGAHGATSHAHASAGERDHRAAARR